MQRNGAQLGGTELEFALAKFDCPPGQSLQSLNAGFICANHQLGAMIEDQLILTGGRTLNRMDANAFVVFDPRQQPRQFERQCVTMIARNFAAMNIELDIGDNRFGCLQCGAAFA